MKQVDKKTNLSFHDKDNDSINQWFEEREKENYERLCKMIDAEEEEYQRKMEYEKKHSKFVLFLRSAFLGMDANGAAHLACFFMFSINFIILWIYFFFPLQAPKGSVYEFIAQAKPVMIYFAGMGDKNNAVGFCYRYLFPAFGIISAIKAIVIIYSKSGFGVERAYQVCKKTGEFKRTKTGELKRKYVGKSSNFFFQSGLFDGWKEVFYMQIIGIPLCIGAILYTLYGTIEPAFVYNFSQDNHLSVFLCNFMYSIAPTVFLMAVIVYIYLWFIVILEQIYLLLFRFFNSLK